MWWPQVDYDETEQPKGGVNPAILSLTFITFERPTRDTERGVEQEVQRQRRESPPDRSWLGMGNRDDWGVKVKMKMMVKDSSPTTRT